MHEVFDEISERITAWKPDVMSHANNNQAHGEPLQETFAKIENKLAAERANMKDATLRFAAL